MGEQQKSKRSGGARKIRSRPARQEKRARNKARNTRGEPTARGARKTRLSAVELILLGKGRYRAFTPEWATPVRKKSGKRRVIGGDDL